MANNVTGATVRADLAEAASEIDKGFPERGKVGRIQIRREPILPYRPWPARGRHQRIVLGGWEPSRWA